MIIPSAEPFFFPGGPVGCLLVHGFTGTPKEMRWLGEYLAVQGCTVLGVRLTGHATCVEDMLRTRWPDWLASVEDGYRLLSGSVKQIYLAGLSLGGILSLTFASGRFNPDCPVDGVVGMAIPHHLPINPLLLKIIKPISLIKRTMAPGPSDWFDKQAEQLHSCYEITPLREVAELRDVLAEMVIGLPEVIVPVKLIYSKDDQTVRPESRHAELIYDRLGSRNKQMVWIEKSGHNLTRDLQRDTVFKHVADFIAEVSNQPAETAADTLETATTSVAARSVA
jgi:carboxylesterase